MYGNWDVHNSALNFLASLHGQSLTTLELSGCVNVTDVSLIRCFTRSTSLSHNTLLNAVKHGCAVSKRSCQTRCGTRDDYSSCCKRTSNNDSATGGESGGCRAKKTGGCSDLVVESAVMFSKMEIEKNCSGCKKTSNCAGCTNSQVDTGKKSRRFPVTHPLQYLSLSGCWRITDASLMLVYCLSHVFYIYKMI